MKRLALLALFLSTPHLFAQMQPPLPAPDNRFKADVLVVVAHPDDDTAISTFLAKAVLDQGKRAAVIFTNRGNSGPDAIAMTQSKALEAVREIEARRSLAARGITNVWFLNGTDTPTQDVLHSLETVGHGQSLEQLIRLIRLTRPDVVLTWMPAYVAGENHGDHQAAGVMTVEAFDLAANPTAFPEQVTAPRWYKGIANYGEGLNPWQPQKLYFFSDASHPEFLKGHGPEYLASDISRTQHKSFAELNREAWKDYATQIDFDEKTLDYFVNMPEYLVLGKSLVPSGVRDDVWAGVSQKPAAYVPPPNSSEPARTGITLELGGPWAFYEQFYRAHGLQSLEGLVNPQTALSTDRQLWVPLLLRNNSNATADVTLHQALPPGWTGNTEDRQYRLAAGSTYPVQLFFTAPDPTQSKSPQTLTWTALDHGAAVGKAQLSVYMEFDGVPQ